MPAKAAKRAAPASPAPAEKRAKQDPLMLGIVDALRQAADLPETCRAMLLAAIPGTLGTPVDQRHEHQATLVSWIGDVINGVRAKLQQSLDEANALEAEAAATKEGLDGKVQEATATSQEKDEACAARTSSLKEAVDASAGAKAAFAEAQEAQRAGDARLVEAGEEKKSLEEALEEHVKPLKEVEGFQADQVEAHLAVLMPIVKRLACDDSLVMTLPAVCLRAPTARGAFDCMVLDQVETSLREHVDKLTGELAAGAPAAAERAAAVAAAQEKLTAAEDTEKAADVALVAARSAQAEAAAALSVAEAAVSAFVSGRKAEADAREAKDFALQNFTGYNVECFNTLRDRTASAGAAEDVSRRNFTLEVTVDGASVCSASAPFKTFLGLELKPGFKLASIAQERGEFLASLRDCVGRASSSTDAAPCKQELEIVLNAFPAGAGGGRQKHPYELRCQAEVVAPDSAARGSGANAPIIRLQVLSARYAKHRKQPTATSSSSTGLVPTQIGHSLMLSV